MNPSRVIAARQWFAIYRGLGYQPLPSDPRPHEDGGRKKPLCRFAEWWEADAPYDLFERFPSTNLQVMTGRHWRLAVLDLDGAEAVSHVERNWPKLPKTWTSYHTGNGRASRHLWFSLPDGLAEKRRTRLWGVWGEDGWKNHTAVELLCDRCLVMGPPSVHPKTRNTYGFVRGLSPFDMARPALLPECVWTMPACEAPRAEPPPELERASPLPVPSHAPRVDRRHLLDSIPDKAAVAKGWGLRFARSSSESNGWVSVHDFNRDDANPSARFNLKSGSFWRPGEKPISLFDLGAILGGYGDWRECRDALAEFHLLRGVRR